MPRPERGKSYTEHLRKIYRSNKDIIEILSYWRRTFRIRSRGLDRGLAYLFEKIRQQRGENGCKRSEKSYRWITMMIAKHNSVPLIMEEIITYGK